MNPSKTKLLTSHKKDDIRFDHVREYHYPGQRIAPTDKEVDKRIANG